MKKVKSLFLLILFVLILCNFTPLSVFANSANSVYLGGFPAGFSLETRGAFVMGLSDVVTFEGIKSPSKEAGVAVGDIILSIDGIAVNNAEDVEKVVKDEKEKLLEIKRCDEKILLDVSPALDMSGNFRLGIFIRDGVNGIGTVTLVNNGRFASLGHPVTDEGGKPLEIIGGKLYNCNITGYIAGERGKAGELRGTFLKTNDIGNIEKNLIKEGVFRRGHIMSADDRHITCKYLKKRENLISFGGKTMALIDDVMEPDLKLERKIHLDFMIVRGRMKTTLGKLLDVYDVDLLIVDSSVPDYLKDRWKEQAAELNIPCWAVKDEGAFVYKDKI